MSKEARKRRIVREFVQLVESELENQGNGTIDSVWNRIKERRLKQEVLAKINRDKQTHPKTSLK